MRSIVEIHAVEPLFRRRREARLGMAPDCEDDDQPWTLPALSRRSRRRSSVEMSGFEVPAQSCLRDREDGIDIAFPSSGSAFLALIKS